MSRMNRQGFTLIELMVVIVIIGVLASLAIPRFTEASAKAKAAEAPRVMASYESAYLAAVAELPSEEVEAGIPIGDLVFEVPNDSKWWTYSGASKTTGDGEEAKTEDVPGQLDATAAEKGMGAMSAVVISTKFSSDDDCFEHKASGGVKDAKPEDAVKKMLPNFINKCEATKQWATTK